MTNIAIPISNGHISFQFEHSSNFLIYTLSKSDSVVIEKHLENGINGHPELAPEWLAMQGVRIVIARGIRKEMAKLLSDNKIFIYVGVSKLEPDALVENFLTGNLETDDKMCY